jgi:3-oxoacyl-[acyl-carrier protein] reductase
MSSRSARDLAVVVTGAGSGIGRATAEVFAGDGARVAVTDIDAQRADDVARALREQGHDAWAWKLDVTNPVEVSSTIGAVAARFGALDVVINNAGIAAYEPIDGDAYETTWDRAISVLLTAQQRIVRAALPHLLRSRCPRVLNIASTEALGATAGHSAYAAAKSGVTGLTRALAVELGREGITVNCICPGPVLTGMTRMIPEDQRTTFARRRTALGRYAEPEEIAHVAWSLCLPAASYVTGAVIPVDGGLMARNG